MNYLLQEQKQFLEEVKEFANLNIRPYVHQFDEKESIPRELILELGKRGLLGATFPKEYGGLDMDPLQYGYLTEIIGKADPSVRSLLTVHTSLVGSALVRWGSKWQKDKWLSLMAEGTKIAVFALTEPETGTDAASIQTSYRQLNDRVIINGRKKWITFSGIADLLLVIARNENKVNSFIVERNTPGITFTPIRGLLAGRSTHICEIEFCNVEIPLENRLGPDGGGFTYITSTALDHGRYSIAWGGLGISSAALEAMSTYCRNRSQFGKKIYNYQLIQEMIANAVSKIHSAKALCEKVAFLRKENHPDALTETVISKYVTSKIAMEITIDAVQTHGGNGCCNEFPVERLFREAKVLEIIEGTSQILQNIISIYGLKKYGNEKVYTKSPEKALIYS